MSQTVPERSSLVYPQFGRLALFQGDLAHGVLQSGFEGKRITFLMNWWAASPKDIQRPTLEYIRGRRLSAAAQISCNQLERHAVREVRWWAELPGCAMREPTHMARSDELVAASSLRCRVLEDSSAEPTRDGLTASEAAEAERADRAAKLVEHSTAGAGVVSWQAALEKGGAVIIDHPGYMVYQTPKYQVVMLPTTL